MQNGEPQTVEEILALYAEERRKREAAELRATTAEANNSELKKENDTLKHDFVTGLPVRVVFEGEFAADTRAMVARPEAQAYLQATTFHKALYPPDHGSDLMNLMFGYADIWLLRYWNNNYDHNLGDHVLKGFADAIRAYEVPWVKVYRAGDRGDEFMVVANGGQSQIANHFLRIKKTLNRLEVPEGALYVPDFDIGWCSIYEALWAYSRVITESPRIMRGGRGELTKVKKMLMKIAEIRGRMQKVRARALLLEESLRKGNVYYDKVCEDLFGGTHLVEKDITDILVARNNGMSAQSLEALVLRIAARPQLEKWEQARTRFAVLRDKDGTDSLIAQVQVEAALYLPPFQRRLGHCSE